MYGDRGTSPHTAAKASVASYPFGAAVVLSKCKKRCRRENLFACNKH